MIPTFHFPAVLLMLFVVPAVILLLQRRRRAALRFSCGGDMHRYVRGKASWVPRTVVIAFASTVALLIIMAAGPRWPDPGTRIPSQGVSIAMVVDVSRTMDNADFLWRDQLITRLTAAKRVFRLFVQGGRGPKNEVFPGRPQDEIGLVVYATFPETACPRTLDHRSLLQVMDAQQARTIPTESYTNTGDALAWALHHLRNTRAKRKLLVLLTDGEHNVPPPALTPRQASQLAGNMHIPIYAIHVGGNAPVESVPEPEGGVEEKQKAEQSLRAIAKMTNGRYFHAQDDDALLRACHDIDQMERETMKTFQYRRYYEGFVWFGLAAFVVLVGVLVMDATFWRRTP